MKNSITLKQVAERVGCSVNAASTVLNGARGKTGVSEIMRQQILATAEEMGYRPNLMARAMKAQRSHQIGVLVRNNSRLNYEEAMAHPVAYEFVLGISEGLEEAGYMMSFVRLSDVDPEKHVQSSAFRGHLLDGLIVVNEVPAAQPERLELLVPHIVWLDTNVWRDNNCIRRDEFDAGMLATKAVADAGYKRVLVLQHSAGATPHFSYHQRLNGVRSQAEQSGLVVETKELPWHQPEAFFETLLPQLQPDVAVLAMDIYVAQRLAAWLMTEEKRPGHDFPLACCDDHFSGGGLELPKLSRVTFDRHKMGHQAARMMIQLLGEAPQVSSQLLQGEWFAGKTLNSRKEK